jgi:hypothetical protein
MDDGSQRTLRPHSYPSYITRSTRTRSGLRPQRASWERPSLLGAGKITGSGKQTPQAADEASSAPQQPICEKRNLSSDSVASTIVPSNQTNHPQQARLKCLLWKILLIVLPIASLSALLLGLVFGLKVKTEPTLFPISDGSDITGQNSYVLVNLSATRLGLVPNSMSLLAPCLGSLIMGLWRICTAHSLQEATRLAETQRERNPRLPDVDDFRFVVGFGLALVEELSSYCVHLWKRRLVVPPVLRKAAAMLLATLVLAGGVLVASTWLQIVMQAINFETITTNPSPTLTFGRGLSKMCLDFNRTANGGHPCTCDMIRAESDYLTIAIDQTEIYYLQQNISRESEIRIVAEPDLPHGDLAVLIPQTDTRPNNIDYRASTIGVSTQCRPMTSQCHMRTVGPSGQHTQFNCTEGFWGVLGKPPNVSTVTEVKAEDPDLPPMAFKPSQSLQYAFFTDPSLRTPYNTAGSNLSTGNPELGSPTLPDSSLINPVFVAVAGRISIDDTSVFSNLPNDPDMFKTTFTWIDVTLNCSYTTFDVNYTLANGAIHNTSSIPSPNGTLAEMYHGLLSFASVDGGDPDLQANLRRAAHQNTSEAFAREWANLYSAEVLSTIGAYTTPRTNIQEQTRTSMIVTQVPKRPLGLLLAFSLSYIVLGVFLGFAAHRSSSAEVFALASELSLAAIVAAAFRVPASESADSKMQSEETNRERNAVAGGPVQKCKRVRTAGSHEEGWGYTVSESAV